MTSTINLKTSNQKKNTMSNNYIVMTGFGFDPVEVFTHHKSRNILAQIINEKKGGSNLDQN